MPKNNWPKREAGRTNHVFKDGVGHSKNNKN